MGVGRQVNGGDGRQERDGGGRVAVVSADCLPRPMREVVQSARSSQTGPLARAHHIKEVAKPDFHQAFLLRTHVVEYHTSQWISPLSRIPKLM